MNYFSFLEQLKKTDKCELSLFVSEDFQEIIKKLEKSKEVTLYTTKELFDIRLEISNLNILTSFKKLFWGIHISDNVYDLYTSPPTSVAIWFDYNNTPHSEWKVNSNDIENFYVVHTEEELIEMINWFIETLNESELFVKYYDNDKVSTWIQQQIDTEYSEE